MSRERIIVCDSGLGGLNIAAAYFARPAGNEEKEILYFNAFPDVNLGFNDLTEPEQEKMLKNVFEGMEKFSPDLCLIACNTVSIIWGRLEKWFTPPFPVRGIVEIAAEGMKKFLLEEDPSSHVLILGTQSTVGSKVYVSRLLEKGVAQERIHALACPGVAKKLESGPATEEVEQSIRAAADRAPALPEGTRCALAFCCTHYAYAEKLWQEAFRKKWGYVPVILDPNRWMARQVTGKGVSFRFVSRIPLFPGAKENMPRLFKKDAPEIAEELKRAEPTPSLFSLKIS